MGDFGFGREAQHKVEIPNRDLLMEFCIGHRYAVAHTFFPAADEEKVTYHEPGTAPMDRITPQGFSVLDLALVPVEWLEKVRSITSNRFAALASHHFLMRSVLDIKLVKPLALPKQPRLDWSALGQSSIRTAFVNDVVDKLPPLNEGSLQSSAWSTACDGMRQAAEANLPSLPKQPNKPWISQDTLDLVDSKRSARARGDWVTEKLLRAKVQKSAKQDRAKWLQDLATRGDWASLRLLRKGRKMQQGRLYNTDGHPVSSEQRADTFAQHLATVQWRVRPVTLVPDVSPAIHPPLPVKADQFSTDELLKAIASMKRNKAVKKNDVPAEAYQALATERGIAFDWVLDFCNLCWSSKSVPHDWATASVAMIYKKGDPGFCDNYRPICLLSIASKVFAAMLKQRLLDAGIDGVLWPSQFGFRTGCSTEDAIFIARRRIELARAQRNGSVSLLALDWAKAFDSINVTSLLDALRRAGLPKTFLNMLEGMLAARTFYVQDFGGMSDECAQLSGISQGCTLSPLLFIIAMSVLLHDAVGLLGTSAANEYAAGELADLVYADDTLLIGISKRHLEEYLHAVCDAGNRYGMELHFGKFQLISTLFSPFAVDTPGGTQVVAKPSMEYLGSTIHSSGLADNEVSKRIAIARADFDALDRTWTHSALTWKQKLQIYSTLVESKFLYSMVSLVLTTAQQRRVNGFQNRCLRRIIGVLPAYVSRVSNAIVLQRSSYIPATRLLQKRRLQQFGKILRSPEGHPLRTATFVPNTTIPRTEQYVRRVGRPCKEWTKEVIHETTFLFGSLEAASTIAMHKESWNDALFDKLGF